MVLLLLGVVLVVLRLVGWNPVVQWPWWWFVLPFIAAAAWWQIADATGLTRRRAEAREAKRRRLRQETAYQDLDPRRRKG